MAWRTKDGQHSDPNRDAGRRGTQPVKGIDVKDYSIAPYMANEFTREAADPEYAKAKRDRALRTLFSRDD